MQLNAAQVRFVIFSMYQPLVCNFPMQQTHQPIVRMPMTRPSADPLVPNVRIE